ncbi:MAG: polysaccharide biosynthesis protein [Thermincolia bacterium]
MNKHFFLDKKILITGGTGTVGQQILLRLLPLRPDTVIIYSRDENKQAAMETEFKSYSNIKFFLGDVRDKLRIVRASKKVDYIFHTAALKHVNACEINPIEAVKTNILGTQNVIEAAMLNQVRKVILTSSDKAVNPANTMGVTKLMAEKLMTAANFARGTSSTVFASVRFGNVLGSRGSVIPIFRGQIQQGGPVSVTDPKMTRFIMDNEDTINLLFSAMEMARWGEVFIAKMPVIRLGDLAEAMVNELAPKYGHEPKNIEINVIGAKPGEKVYEELVSEDESSRTEEKNGLWVVKNFTGPIEAQSSGQGQLKGVNSHMEVALTKKELIHYLHNKKLI